MYQDVKNLILIYEDEDDPIWECIGLERVMEIFNGFSAEDWARFIVEIPEDVSDINAHLMDCLTQHDSDMAFKASLKVAFISETGSFDLFFFRLTEERLDKISISDLEKIEVRARKRLEVLEGDFADIYKELLDPIQESLAKVKTELISLFSSLGKSKENTSIK